jgi:hypothetical protein
MFSIRAFTLLIENVEDALNLCLGATRLGLVSRNHERPNKVLNQKRLGVVLNGPSLAYEDLDDNIDEFWASNFFALSEFFFTLKPSAYILVDPAFTGKTERGDLAERVEKLWSVFELVDWTMKIYVLEAPKLKLDNPNVEVVRVRYNPIVGGSSRISIFLWRSGLATPHFQNVLVACLWIGFVDGYSEIKVYGANHDWFRNLYIKNEKLVLLSEHFYSREGKLTDLYFNDRPMEMSEFFDQFRRLHKTYKQLDSLARQLGSKVYLKGKGIMINTFLKDDE